MGKAAPVADGGEAPADDPVKHLRDQLSSRGREMAQMRADQAAHVAELQELKKFRESQLQKAQQANLRRWDPKHPENSKFQDLARRVAYAREQNQKLSPPPIPEGMDPQQGKLWQDAYVHARKAELAGSIDQKDWEEHAAWEDDQKSFQQKFYADPKSVMRDFFQEEINQAFQAREMESRARAEVERDRQDEFLGPAMEEHQHEFAEVVQKLGSTDEAYDTARHMLKLATANKQLVQQLAELRQQQGALEGRASAAAAQQQLVKRKASVTADPRPSAGPSAFQLAKEWAEKNGHSTASDAFMKKVSELTAKQFGRPV